MIFRQNLVRLTPSQDARQAAGRQGLPPLWVHLGFALLPLTTLAGCRGDGAGAVRNGPARTSAAGDARPAPTPQGPWILVPFAGDPVDPARDYLGGALGDRAAWRSLGGILVQNGTLYLAEGDHTIRAAANHGGPWEGAELAAFAGRRAMPSPWTGQPGVPGDGFLTAPGAMAALGGDLIVAEPSRHCLKRVPLNGPEGWTIFAGRPGTPGAQGGGAPETRLGAPVALASDGTTQVFAADAQHGLVWRFTAEGAGEAITAHGVFQDPQGMALAPDGRLYVADRGAHAIFRLTRSDSGVWGAPERVAGIPGQPGFQDGGADEARLREPMGLAFDASGRLLVADAGNHALRILRLDGSAPALGTLTEPQPWSPEAGQPGHQDGLIAEARYNRPTRLALGQGGEIFVVEEPGGGASSLRLMWAGRVTTLGRRDLGPALDLPGAGTFGPMGALAALRDGRLLAADHGARVLRVLRDRTLAAPIPYPAGVQGPVYRLAATSDGAIRLLPAEGREVFISRDGATWAPEGRGPLLDLAASGEALDPCVAELRARDGGARVTLVRAQGEVHVDLAVRPQAMALDAGNNLLVALPGEAGGIVLERHLAGAEGYRPDPKPAVHLTLGEHAGRGAILALVPLDGDRVLLADASNVIVWEARFDDGSFRAWAGAHPFVESRRTPRSSGDPLSALAGMARVPGGDLYLATGHGLLRATQGGARPGPGPGPGKGPHPRGPRHPQVDPAPASPLAEPHQDAGKLLVEDRKGRAPLLAEEDPVAQLQALLRIREGQLAEARAAGRNTASESATVIQLRTRLEALQAERNQHEAASAQATAQLRALIDQHKLELTRLRDHLGAEAETVRAHLRARLAEAEALLQTERDQHQAAAAQANARLVNLIAQQKDELTRLNDLHGAEAEAARAEQQARLANAEAVLQAVLQGGEEDRDREAEAHAKRAQALEARVWEVGGLLAKARREGRQADQKAEVRLAECRRALAQALVEAEALRARDRENGRRNQSLVETTQAELKAMGLRMDLAREEASRNQGNLQAEIKRLQALNAERVETIRILTPMIMDLKKAASRPNAEAQLQSLQAANAALRDQLARLQAQASASAADEAQLAALRAENGRLDLLSLAMERQVKDLPAAAAPQAPSLLGLAPGTRGVLYALEAQGKLFRHTFRTRTPVPVRDGNQDLPLRKVATLNARGDLMALALDGRVFGSFDAGQTWQPLKKSYPKVLDLVATPQAQTRQAAFLLEAGPGYTVAIRRQDKAESRVMGTGTPGPMALGADGAFALVVDSQAAFPILRIYRPDGPGHVLAREMALTAALPLTIGPDGIQQPRIQAMAFSPTGALVLVDAANRTLWRMNPDGRFVASVSPALLRQVFQASVPPSSPLPEPLDLGFTASGGLWILHAGGIGFLKGADATEAPRRPLMERNPADLPLGTILRASQRTSLDPKGRPWVLDPQGAVARWDAEHGRLVAEARFPQGALELAASPWKDQVATIHPGPQGGFRLSLAGPDGVQGLDLPRRPSALSLMPDGRAVLAFQAPHGWAQVIAFRATPAGLERDGSLDLRFGPDLLTLQAPESDRAPALADVAPAVTLTAMAADAQGILYLLDGPQGVLYRSIQGRTVEILATGLHGKDQAPLNRHFLQVGAEGQVLLARADEPFVLPLNAARPGLAGQDHLRRSSHRLIPKSRHLRARLARERRARQDASTPRTPSAQESTKAMIETSPTGPTPAETSATLTSLLHLGEDRLVILDSQGRLHLRDARGQAGAFPVETGPGALRVASIARGRKGGLLLQSGNGRFFAWNPANPSGLEEQGDTLLGRVQIITPQAANHAVLQRMVDAPHPFQIAVNRVRDGVQARGAVLKLEARPLAWGLDGDGTLVVLRNPRTTSNNAPQRVLERYRTTELHPTEYQRCEMPVLIQGMNLRGPFSAYPHAVDLAVTPRGQVLVADPANRTIWRLEPGTGTLSAWAGPERLEAARHQVHPEGRGPIQGPNGLAVADDRGVHVTLADCVVWLPFQETDPSRPDTDPAARPEEPESKRSEASEVRPESKDRTPGFASATHPVETTPDPDMAETLREAAEAIAYAESVTSDVPSPEPRPASPNRTRKAANRTQGRAFLPAGGYGSLSPHLGRSLKR